MIRIISIILALLSSGASLYYMFTGITKPETTVVYNRANISHLGIQVLSLFLGIGGVFLLFPPTFKVGGAFLIIHSLLTIVCFVLLKDWKGAAFELLFLQIPIFILWEGYPFRNL